MSRIISIEFITDIFPFYYGVAIAGFFFLFGIFFDKLTQVLIDVIPAYAGIKSSIGITPGLIRIVRVSKLVLPTIIISLEKTISFGFNYSHDFFFFFFEVMKTSSRRIGCLAGIS